MFLDETEEFEERREFPRASYETFQWLVVFCEESIDNHWRKSQLVHHFVCPSRKRRKQQHRADVFHAGVSRTLDRYISDADC